MNKKIHEIICKYLFKQETKDSIKLESSLINDLHINSSKIVEIVVDIEEQFDIKISHAKIPYIKTVQDLHNFLPSV